MAVQGPCLEQQGCLAVTLLLCAVATRLHPVWFLPVVATQDGHPARTPLAPGDYFSHPLVYLCILLGAYLAVLVTSKHDEQVWTAICPSLSYPLPRSVPVVRPLSWGSRTSAQARNLHKGRTTLLRRRRWQHTVSGRSAILEAACRMTTTNAACLPGQRRRRGSITTVCQCRASNLGHILRYQLSLLCPSFEPVSHNGRSRRRRPRRGKRRVHRPKRRASVPTQPRLRSDYVPTPSHYAPSQPCP